jgi:hypothetical protein
MHLHKSANTKTCVLIWILLAVGFIITSTPVQCRSSAYLHVAKSSPAFASKDVLIGDNHPYIKPMRTILDVIQSRRRQWVLRADSVISDAIRRK